MPASLSRRPTRTSLSASTALGRVALGVAAGTLAGGYGRITYAGTCAAPAGTPGTYLCSGPAQAGTDVTQSFGPIPGGLTINSAPDFGLDTTQSGGRGVETTRDRNDAAPDIQITTSNIRASGDAISAEYIGPTPQDPYDYSPLPFGSVEIDTTGGQVASENATGILAEGIRDYITITTSDVSGAEGIATRNRYYGLEHSFTQIDTTAGTVTGTAGAGITAFDGDIRIRTSDVTGASDGIRATPGQYLLERFGFAGIDTTSGTVTGLDGDGISADVGNIFITSADVTGSEDGITASSRYYQVIQIDSTAGIVTGTNGTGISATVEGYYPFSARGDLSIKVTTGDVTGGDTGIRTRAGRDIETTINTAAGSVRGKTGAGIAASGEYGRIEITATDVTGETTGISVSNPYSTIVMDTTGGTVTGETGAGIDLSFRSDIDITVSDVTGGTDGIAVYGLSAFGYSDTDVIDTTAGTVTGQTGAGIAVNYFDSGRLQMTVSDVAGAVAGIQISGTGYDEYRGPPETSIDVQGHVSGAVGITLSDLGGTAQINSSGLIEGRDGTALDLDDGVQDVTISDAVQALPGDMRPGLIGASLFGGGNDELSFIDMAGGGNILYDGVFDGLFDGGEGIDTVNFSVSFDALQSSAGSGSAIDLLFAGEADQRVTLSFLDFEFFTFTDNPNREYSLADLRNPVAPIPLPAGYLFLGTALAALGFTRSRSARRSS